LPPGTALVGVGGYGRGELFPYSDVDLLILLEQAPDAGTRKSSKNWCSCCGTWAWKSATASAPSTNAWRIGGRHHGADQPARSAPRLRQRDLFAQLQQRYDAAMDPRPSSRPRLLEMRQRHAKYEDTAFSLEPNCKESPGGLRDLQVILWVAKAAGLANSWRTWPPAA
jgi:[protein-PII] uridylyltransferase